MTVREPAKKRGVRLLLSLLFVIGTVVSISAGVQQSASAATCLTGGDYDYTIAAGCYTVEVYSKCLTFGSYTDSGGTTNAVECADIYATVDSSYNVYIWGEGEFSCQGEHPQCAGMNVNDSLTGEEVATNIGTSTPFTQHSGSWQCNPTVGACPGGGHKELGTTKYSYPGAYEISTQYTIEPAGEAILIAGASSTSKSPYFTTPQITIRTAVS